MPLPQTSPAPQRYRELFDANPLPTWAFDRNTLAFLEVNQAALDLYGYSRTEFLSMTIADIRPPEDVPQLLADLRALQPVSGVDTWRHSTRDGRIISVSLRGKDFSFDGVAARLVVAHDITAQLESETALRRLNAQLQQARKLEAIGRLSGGIAHDFNNILTAVLAHASFLMSSLPPGDPRRDDASKIERAARCGADLTQQLLAFSRKKAVAPTVLDLSEVVRGMESMLQRLLGEDVVLATSSDGEANLATVDRSQLEQVLLNLAANARDAMPSGGDLRIETERVRVGVDDFVVLRVTDSGCGMDQETMERIFEPFYTSKEPGKGTGLGLATVYGIVQQSGGQIEVRSEPGQGTTFEIVLPRAPDPAREPATPLPLAPQAGPAVILLVDDDDAVRNATRRALTGSHRVLAAATPDQARAVCATHDGQIDLLLTDVVMPGTSGIDLAAELASQRPSMKVLFMSGYVDHPSTRGAVAPRLRLVEKPFAPADLLASVDDVLRRG